jgi:hypothetical protein
LNAKGWIDDAGETKKKKTLADAAFGREPQPVQRRLLILQSCPTTMTPSLTITLAEQPNESSAITPTSSLLEGIQEALYAGWSRRAICQQLLEEQRYATMYRIRGPAPTLKDEQPRTA